VDALYDDYEVIGDQVIRLLADEPRVSGTPELLNQGRTGHRRWTEAAFAPQLEAKRGAAREQALICLLLATDGSAIWPLPPSARSSCRWYATGSRTPS
jgi:hypothetical protein